MTTKHSQTTVDETLESRRVAAIFGVLTLSTVLPLGAIIAIVMAVTTGQGARALIIGLGIATVLACICAVTVARQTLAQHQLSTTSA
jgi:hypothetical protein